MPTVVNVHEAKTHLSRLLERAHAGEEIILAKAGKPYARLVPLEKARRKLGLFPFHIPDSFFEDLSEEELAEWDSGPVFPPELNSQEPHAT